jgi:hypothetical protein
MYNADFDRLPAAGGVARALEAEELARLAAGESVIKCCYPSERVE